MKPLDIKEQFNTLPIFICSAIRSHFKNVFSIDLTGMDIDEDYLEIIQNERQHLIGFLTYFFVRYMEIFEHSIQLTEGKTFEYKNEIYDNPAKLIKLIIKNATILLFSLHDTYSPTLQTAVTIDTDSMDPAKSKQQIKTGKKYAANIMKYYKTYGVSITILSNAEYKNDRYIFSVKLLTGTDKNLISSHADDVRRLLGVEFFYLK